MIRNFGETIRKKFFESRTRTGKKTIFGKKVLTIPQQEILQVKTFSYKISTEIINNIFEQLKINQTKKRDVQKLIEKDIFRMYTNKPRNHFELATNLTKIIGKDKINDFEELYIQYYQIAIAKYQELNSQYN